MTWHRKDTDKARSYNFLAPEGAEGDAEKNEILFPFPEKLTPAHATTQAVTVRRAVTVLQPGNASANTTINLTLSDELPIGALLHLKIKATGAQRTVTLGTGFDEAAANLTVAQDATAFALFVYDGTAFMPAG